MCPFRTEKYTRTISDFLVPNAEWNYSVSNFRPDFFKVVLLDIVQMTY